MNDFVLFVFALILPQINDNEYACFNSMAYFLNLAEIRACTAQSRRFYIDLNTDNR
jgi:hypothetical protein